jgi:hypothetical protein
MLPPVICVFSTLVLFVPNLDPDLTGYFFTGFEACIELDCPFFLVILAFADDFFRVFSYL